MNSVEHSVYHTFMCGEIQNDANHFTENNVGLFFSATHNSSSYICECNNMYLILVHVRYRSAVGR